MRVASKKGSAREIERERFGSDIPPPPPFVVETPSQLLDSVIKSLGLEQRTWAHNLAQDWPAIVGEQLAAHTRPGEYMRGSLTIYVDSSPWLRALEMEFRGMLSDKLREACGADRIKKIRFALDPGA